MQIHIWGRDYAVDTAKLSQAAMAEAVAIGLRFMLCRGCGDAKGLARKHDVIAANLRKLEGQR